MALPPVRIFVWLVKKTLSSAIDMPDTAPDDSLSERAKDFFQKFVLPIGASEPSGVDSLGSFIRGRLPEIAMDFFQINPDQYIKLELSDGVAEVDDTFTLRMTEDAMSHFIKLRDTRLYPIFIITVGTRLFGPYDLNGMGYTGESREFYFNGKIDKEFEDTVIDKWYTAFFSPFSLPTTLSRLIQSSAPWKDWNADDKIFIALIISRMASSKNLSGIRGALNPFGIGISPLTIPRIFPNNLDLVFFERDVDIYAKYPTVTDGIQPINQTTRYLKAGFQGDLINSAVFQETPKLVKLNKEDLWQDAPPSIDIPDSDNAPGAYRFRRIDMAIQTLQANATIYTSGSELPRVILDISGENGYWTTYLENARWQLQNTAATASVKLKGRTDIISNQFVELPEDVLGYKYWRITAVRHMVSPTEGYSTSLSLALIQGLYNPDLASLIRRYNALPDFVTQSGNIPDSNAGGLDFGQTIVGL